MRVCPPAGRIWEIFEHYEGLQEANVSNAKKFVVMQNSYLRQLIFSAA